VLDYFVVVVGNEAKCAVLGDQPTQQLLNAWGVLLLGVSSNFWVGGGAPPLCDLSEAAEIFFKMGLQEVQRTVRTENQNHLIV